MMTPDLEKVLQQLIANEIGKIDADWDRANHDGVDAKAVATLLWVHDLAEVLNDLLKQANGMKAKFADQLAEQYSLHGVQSMAVNGRNVHAHVDKFANAKPECQQQIIAWARANGLDDLIAMQPARFKSWCREQLDDETQRGLPAELEPMVNVFEQVSLRIRRN